MKKNYLPSVIAAIALAMTVSPMEAQVTNQKMPTPESMIEKLPMPERQKLAVALNREQPQQRAMHNAQSTGFTHYLSGKTDQYGRITRYEYNDVGLCTHETTYRYYYSANDNRKDSECIYEYDTDGKRISVKNVSYYDDEVYPSPSSMELYRYDPSTDEAIYYESYNLDENKKLVLTNKREETRIDEYTNQHINLSWFDGQPSGEKYVFVTNKDHLIMTESHYILGQDGEWALSGIDEYTYDGLGRILYYTHKENNVLTSKSQYTYNDKGGYEAITTDGEGALVSKSVCPEEPRDGYYEQYSYSYDKEQKQWIQDGYSKSISDKYSSESIWEGTDSWDNSSFMYYSKRTYDDHGLVLTYTYNSTNESETRKQEQQGETIYTRNAEGDPISEHSMSVYKSYNKATQNYSYGDKSVTDTEYYYNESMDGRKVMGCEWSRPLLSENTTRTDYNFDNYTGEFYDYGYENRSSVNYEYEVVPLYANGLKFEVLADNEVSIIGYSEKPGVNFVVPATVSINGKNYNVVEIGNDAFQGCKEMRSVDIPASIRYMHSDAFYDCELEVVISRGLNIDEEYEWYSDQVFQSATRRHGVLYAPADKWHEYAFSEQWGYFYNIKRNVSEARLVSPQKTYTMLDSRNMQYLVYNPASGAVQTLSSVSELDESNPNHCWMAVKTEQGSYLYNMGAKQYVEVSVSGYRLMSDAVANATTQEEHGVLLSNGSRNVWNFVENTQIDADPNVFGNVSGISTIEFNGNDAVETYNAAGQRNNGLQPGLNLMRHANGKAEKIIVR